MKSQCRTRLEAGARKEEKKKPFPIVQVLILVVCAIAVCVLGVTYLYPSSSDVVSTQLLIENVGVDTCLSDDCINISNEILSSMDTNADPCEDFYEFSCGKYKQGNFENVYSPMYDENIRFANQLAAIIKEPISDSDWEPLVNQKKIYQACMDTQAMDDSRDKYPFLKLINSVGGWPVVQGKIWASQWEKQFHWKRTMMLCRKSGLPYQWFVRFIVDHNLNLTIMAPEIEESDDFDEIVYRGLMEDTVESMGAPKDILHQEIQDVLDFKKKLMELQKRYQYDGVVYKPIGKITWITFPLIRWKTVLEELRVSLRDYTDDDNVFVQEKYLGELGYLLEHTSIRAQANYIIWKVVEEFGMFMPMPMRGIFEKYSLYQNKKLQTRADICVEFAKLKFPHVVEASFVQKHIDQEDVDKVTSILENIKNQYKSDISLSDWIDQNSKINAVRKIEGLKSVVGFKKQFSSSYKTAKLLQWDGFSLRESNIIDMLRHYNGWIRSEMPNFDSYHKLGRILELASHVNAYQLMTTNTIIITPGLMQGRGFNKNRPSNLNYAVLGTAIAHEIAHGLDANAEVLVENDIALTLWENNTYVEVEDILDCIRIQHKTSRDQTSPISTDMIMENFADLVGTERSYRAYLKALTQKQREELILPGLDYSPNQLFWLRYATVMCDGDENLESKRNGSSEGHGDSKFRINMAFRNYQSFSRDFGCAVGTGMNPIDKCRGFSR